MDRYTSNPQYNLGVDNISTPPSMAAADLLDFNATPLLTRNFITMLPAWAKKS